MTILDFWIVLLDTVYFMRGLHYQKDTLDFELRSIYLGLHTHIWLRTHVVMLETILDIFQKFNIIERTCNLI